MDIQKELIDCNNWILEQDDDFVSGYGQGNYALGLARLAWQAAKAQAAPEGFALVPTHTLEECLSWAHVAKWDSPSKEVENEIEHHELIIESIIEAQEPKFDLDEFLIMEQKLKSKGGIIKADLDRFIAYAEMVLEKAKALKEPK